MKSVALIAAFLAIASSYPIRRQVPQEHSHNGIVATVRASLALNNPAKIADPIFGLLGNAAAATGQGSISNTDCLQQAIADQAFTNAKAAGDVPGQIAALQFRALERNTGSVGTPSVLCTAIKATNPEIAAISQHQDPASPNAAATNKAIVLELAKQINTLGGDPTLALKTGTFAPGTIGDPTAKGNSCDDDEAGEGCIFSKNLLVEDATADEIAAAVAGTGSGTGVGVGNAGAGVAGTAVSTSIEPSATGTECSLVTVTMTMTIADAAETTTAAAAATTTAAPVVVATTTSAAAPAATTTTAAASTGGNLQTFTGALGGVSAPSVVAGGKGFQTNNAEFLNLAAALGRSCDVQHNQCANKANSGGQTFTVSDCDTQNNQCKAAAN